MPTTPLPTAHPSWSPTNRPTSPPTPSPIAYNCTIGTSGATCKSCLESIFRTGNDQCLTCHQGHKLDVQTAKCKPYACNIGPGTLCKVCMIVELRDRDNQCLECNPGYFPDGGGLCQPYACNT